MSAIAAEPVTTRRVALVPLSAGHAGRGMTWRLTMTQ
jgi:hypothetical protein